MYVVVNLLLLFVHQYNANFFIAIKISDSIQTDLHLEVLMCAVMLQFCWSPSEREFYTADSEPANRQLQDKFFSPT